MAILTYAPGARYYVLADRIPANFYAHTPSQAADLALTLEYQRGLSTRVVRCETTDDLRRAVEG